ncbi:hypothetical protein ACHRVW_12670 [Flavobacterium collinsii]|uniref:hypothetical protein n=1 Tax=Flavobacterium collinsii TaxID=1114861 RepID=UPI003757AF6A
MIKIIAILILSLVSFQKKSGAFPGVNYRSVKPIEVKSSELLGDTTKRKYLDKCIWVNAPVKIISSTLMNNEYSSFKDIRLTFKNVTKKNIQAIKFQWYTENALGEPSNLKSSFYLRGESCGLYTDLLKTKKISTVVFEEFSSDAKRIISAQAYEVVFSDGTKWKPRNQKYLDVHLIKHYRKW